MTGVTASFVLPLGDHTYQQSFEVADLVVFARAECPQQCTTFHRNTPFRTPYIVVLFLEFPTRIILCKVYNN